MSETSVMAPQTPNITERPERLKRAQHLAVAIDGELAKRQSAKTVLEQMRRSALADLKKAFE